MKMLADHIDQRLEDPEPGKAWLEGEDEHQDRRAREHAQAKDEPVSQGLCETV